jgi:Rho-binding antiterminator
MNDNDLIPLKTRHISWPEYTPIDCSTYAGYELAILKGQALKVNWIDRNRRHHIETLKPYDLRTRRHSEFMLARNQHGIRRVLRLDRIRSATLA